MVRIFKYRKIFKKLAASAGVMVFLCLYALFVTTSSYVSDAMKNKAADQVFAVTSSGVRVIDDFFGHANDFRGSFPKNEKVRDLPLIPEKPEAIKTAQAYTVSYYVKYFCGNIKGELSCNCRSGQNIISNIKNDFYCRI